MPGIKDFFKKKEKREKRQRSEFAQKLIQHRRMIAARTLIAILTCAGIVLAVYISYQNKVYTEYEVISSVEREDTEKASFVNYNGNILKYSKDGATAMDINNEMLWNETYEMQDPIVRTCKDYVAIGDYEGSRIFIMDKTGAQGEINTTVPIQDFVISAQGVVAAVLEEKKATLVTLFDKNGNKIADVKTSMEQSGYPIGISLSEDGIKLAIAYLHALGSEISSTVGFFNFGEVGQNEVDRFVGGYDYDGTLIPRVKFINNSTAFALGDNLLTIYKGNQKPVQVFSLKLEDEVRSVFYGGSRIGLVFRNGTEEGKYRLDVYDTSGTLVLSKPFDMEYTDILFDRDMVIIYNDTDCTIYNMNGMEKYKGSFDHLVSLVIPTDKRMRYILVSSGSTEVIQLK